MHVFIYVIIYPLIDIAVDHQALLKQFEYLNHMNPHTFEVDDLDRLIKSVNLIATLYTRTHTHTLRFLLQLVACDLFFYYQHLLSIKKIFFNELFIFVP